jgi:hypothetical protein
LPLSTYFKTGLTFDEIVARYLNLSQFVLFDYKTDPFSAWIIQDTANLSAFGLEVEADGIFLYERGWSGPPRLWVPETFIVYGNQVEGNVPGEKVVSGPNGPALYIPPHVFVPQVLMLFGPSLYTVPAGRYLVTFSLALQSQSQGAQLRLESGGAPQLVNVSKINVSPQGYDYAFQVGIGSFQFLNLSFVSSTSSGSSLLFLNQTMDVDWPNPWDWLNQIYTVTDTAAVTLYSIEIQQIAPP